VTASDDTTARIWDAETGQQLLSLVGHRVPISSAAFSPDGRRVVTASFERILDFMETTARIWDAETGQQLIVLKGHQMGLQDASFSQDGRRVITASYDRTARIWDAEDGRELGRIEDDDQVLHAAFSPDGRRVLTTSTGRSVHIWDIATNQKIADLVGHDSSVSSAAFSPDGRRVVTASSDRTARIWRVFSATQDLVDNGKQLVPRCLTRDQRKKAALELEPPDWCITMEKWPYSTQEWKDWFKLKRANITAPMPEPAPTTTMRGM
jgi:WD40 repeat protein